MRDAWPFLSPLNELSGVRAAWIERIPDVAIHGDRDHAMRQLRPFHEAAVRAWAGPGATWWRAEQVHGNAMAVVPGPDLTYAPDGLPVVPGVDGLLSCAPGTVLAIYVADCAAIWLADRRSGAIGLLHSGKKGSEGNILRAAVEQMARSFGSQASDLVAVVSPCIRVPDYDVDFAAMIARQAADCGIGEFLDCAINTAADLNRFYSYRKERGITGRMLALIVRDSNP